MPKSQKRRPVQTWSSVLGVLSIAVALAAMAPAANAYPEPVCRVVVSAHTNGTARTVEVTGSSAVPQTWRLSYAGQSVSVRGRNVMHRFVTSATTSGVVAAKCGPGGTQHVGVPTAPGHHQSQAAPSSSSHSGGLLPNTGGPTFWLLILGLLLVIGGGLTAVLSRRRRGPRQ